MGAERSHELPSTSWSPRKASGVSQSKSKGVGTRGADAVTPGRRQELSPSSISETGKRQILPRPSPQTPLGPDDAHPPRGRQSTESANSDANLLLKHPHRHTPETVCNPGTPRPVELTHKINHPRFLPPHLLEQGSFTKDSNEVGLIQEVEREL